VVDRARARDRHDPGERGAAPRVEVGAALPDLEEHLLHHVLGRAALAERLAQEAEDGRAEIGMEVAQRLRVAPAQPRGEPAVGAARRAGRGADLRQAGTEESDSGHAGTYGRQLALG
jgi:hypothetical protein